MIADIKGTVAYLTYMALVEEKAKDCWEGGEFREVGGEVHESRSHRREEESGAKKKMKRN